MKEIVAKVIDPVGLHARPASLLVNIASKYISNITVFFDEKSGNAKSVISLMALAIRHGSDIKIKIEGDDEEAAYDEILKFLKEQKVIE